MSAKNAAVSTPVLAPLRHQRGIGGLDRYDFLCVRVLSAVPLAQSAQSPRIKSAMFFVARNVSATDPMLSAIVAVINFLLYGLHNLSLERAPARHRRTLERSSF